MQRLKYRLLQHLPGRHGCRYSRKYKSVLALDEFEAAVARSAGKTCIDLGANVGHYTRKMAMVAREVIAFEPDPWAVEQLRYNLGAFPNVRVEEAAVSTRSGVGVLWRRAQFSDDPRGHSASSSLVKRKIQPISPNQSVVVTLVNFVEYLDGLNPNSDIGVVKMDIEGEELDILDALLCRHDLLTRMDSIFVETHERQIPDQKDRVLELKTRVTNVSRPRINLDWH